MPTYKGFNIRVTVNKSTLGGYVATVTLAPIETQTTRAFDLPLDEDLPTQAEALNEAIQYGRDLVDGLLPWFDAGQYRGAALNTAQVGDCR